MRSTIAFMIVTSVPTFTASPGAPYSPPPDGA